MGVKLMQRPLLPLQLPPMPKRGVHPHVGEEAVDVVEAHGAAETEAAEELQVTKPLAEPL